MLLPAESGRNKNKNRIFYLKTGQLLANQGQLFQAASNFMEVLRLNPGDPFALNALGVIYWNLYRRGESLGNMAIRYLYHCREKHRDNREAVLNLAVMLHDVYKSYAAKAVCESWLHSYPDDQEVKELYSRITSAPNSSTPNKVNLHNEHFTSRDYIKDQHGVFVGSTKYKLAYLVINKCGCSSFRDMVLRLDYKGSGRQLNNMHSHYDNDFSLFAPKTRLLPDYFRFTFVRNPYSRVLSFYTDRILNDTNERFITYEAPQYKSVFRSGMSFQDFTKQLLQLPMEEIEQHLAPQTLFLFSRDRLVVDFIGRLERIEKDFQVLKGYIDDEMEILHLRKTTLPEHSALYDEEAAARIYRKYKADFDFLGYEKDSWLEI